ncbi:MAG: putative signal transducing protein [Planctomycetota bacterium]
MSERDVEGVPEPLVVVFVGKFPRAGMLRSLLEAEGLLAFLQDENLGSLDVHWLGGGSNGVKVAVPESQVERARELLRELGEK